MKKILLFLLPALAASFSSCSSDDDGGKSALNGLTFTCSDSKNHSHTSDFTFGDAEWKRMSQALNWCPKDKVEQSYTYKDTVLTLNETESTNGNIYFYDDENARQDISVNSSAERIKVTKYHHVYKFKDSPYVEGNSNQLLITKDLFSIYDIQYKTKYEFMLDGNYKYEIIFYMKNGASKLETDNKHITDNLTYTLNQNSLSLKSKNGQIKNTTVYPGNHNTYNSFELDGLLYTLEKKAQP